MSSEADQFFDTLNYVLQFLRAESFSKTEDALRLELNARFDCNDDSVNDEEEYIHDQPGPPTPAVEEPTLPDPRHGNNDKLPTPAPPPVAKPQQAARRSSPPSAPPAPLTSESSPHGSPPSAPAPSPAVSPAVSPPVSPPVSPRVSPSKPLPSGSSPSPAGGSPAGGSPAALSPTHSASYPDVEEDEYENMDDAGYYRREVIGQQQFVDTELVMSDEEDGHDAIANEQPAPRSPTSATSANSQSSSDSGASLQFSSEPPRSSSPASIPPTMNEDESWALGPTDIKMADPVISVDTNEDPQHPPRLHRVESLSNSFKDDDVDSCGNSFIESEQDLSAEPSSTVDLLPPGLPQSYLPEFKGVFDSLHSRHESRTSSLDVQQSEVSDTEIGGQKATLIIQTITNNSNREDGFGGGFSFPITPPTSEPDQLFSSWPSFHHSRTSEASPDMPGNSDDESPAQTDQDSKQVALDRPVANGASAEEEEAYRNELTAHMISLSVDDYTEPEPETDHDDEADDAATSKQGKPPVEAPGTPTEEVSSPRSRRTWELPVTSDLSLAPEAPAYSPATPTYVEDEDGKFHYVYNEEYISHKYETFNLSIIHRRHRTGFEESKDFPIRINDLIAGRYQVLDCLGSAAFSRAVQALDIKEGTMVCLKIIKNNKDYFDQSLDEVKLLHFVNSMDPHDEHGVVRLYDYFYYKEHLFLVCELLRANLYEFQKFNRESTDPPYFTLGKIQKIAVQVLHSLQFLHSLDLIHSDLKPENILIKSYSNCEVKVIDLGSSCFITDHLSSYVQSRSYRAPEVILGLPYDHKIDLWSLGCILAELSSGFVLFQNDSLATLLARLEGILGPIPSWMVQHSKYGSRFFTRSGMLYEVNPATKRYELLVPKRTSLRFRMPDADEGFCEFVRHLLAVDPHERPTAAEALKHPWLQRVYEEE